MQALLYVDLLGVRAEWSREGERGGRAAAEVTFGRLQALFREAILDTGSQHFRQGGLESDSVALVFSAETYAAQFAMDVYRRAFRSLEIEADLPRLWLRGAIVPFEGADLRSATALAAPYESIELFEYSGSLLDAISAERSGIKGMRILVRQDLVTIDLQDTIAVEFEGRRIDPLLQLPYTRYPTRVEEEGYQDLLWMAHPGTWNELKETMSRRLQRAVKASDEEFLQAAATQVIFHECAELVEAP